MRLACLCFRFRLCFRWFAFFRSGRFLFLAARRFRFLARWRLRLFRWSSFRFFLLLRGEQLAWLRGVPIDCSYVLRLLQNSTLSNLCNRFCTANDYAVNLQCLFRYDSSSNELSLPLTLITRPISYSG